ncbi:hypothetical protein TI04_05230 [Achromatium sp. WMS2]|nr:hypothetical protein TI04_05230 [Achromatium sp. WMS2]
MIHDTELRDLFRIECDEHLKNLENGLLYLERYPDARETMEALQRELHNIKGSARMMGVTDMEAVSHSMEEVIKRISDGEIILLPDVVDILETGLDTLRTIANEAVTGSPAASNVPEVLASLSQEYINNIIATASDNDESASKSARDQMPMVGAASDTMLPNTINTTELANVSPNSIAVPSTIHAHVQANSQVSTETASYNIDSIRVDPKKLDIIMTRVGELMVTKGHVERWLPQVENLIGLWEYSNRELKMSSISNAILNRLEQIGTALYPLRQAAFEDSTALNRITDGLESDIKALRLLPIERIFQLFPRTVRDIAKTLDKDVKLTISGGDTAADKHLIELLKDPLMHLVRNAIYHGVELPQRRLELGKSPQANLILRAKRTAAHIVVEVIDDGRGLDLEAIKDIAIHRNLYTPNELATMPEIRIQNLIFASGFSTSKVTNDISGRGVGLNVVKSNIEALKGSIALESAINQGCKFTLTLPLTLATTRVFLVTVANNHYAIPVEIVSVARYVNLDEIFLVQDQQAISVYGQAVSIAWLEDLLELPKSQIRQANSTVSLKGKNPCLILELNNEYLGVFIDEIVEELEIVLKPTGPLLKRVRNVSGITILGSGEVCVVLNPFDLMRTAQKQAAHGILPKASNVQIQDSSQFQSKTKKPVILLAEDSITTRAQEKRILEMAGYEVVAAVDGLAALNLLETRPFDAIVSDVEMPNMDGLTLTAKVRENKLYEHLPIILVTSLASDKDRKRGMDVGADAYITKSVFNQQVLIDTLSRLV